MSIKEKILSKFTKVMNTVLPIISIAVLALLAICIVIINGFNDYVIVALIYIIITIGYMFFLLSELKCKHKIHVYARTTIEGLLFCTFEGMEIITIILLGIGVPFKITGYISVMFAVAITIIWLRYHLKKNKDKLDEIKLTIREMVAVVTIIGFCFVDFSIRYIKLLYVILGSIYVIADIVLDRIKENQNNA